MKKVYLLSSALMIGSLAMGQRVSQSGGLSPFMEAVPAERTNTSAVEHYANVDRGSAFWTETFGNGLSGDGTNGTWTTPGTNGDIWKHDMFGPEGCYSLNTPTPSFTTTNNGFMLFDCDSANCIDATTTPPTFNQDPKEGELVSPSIDLSAETTVNVVFEQTFRYCCTATLELMFGVSTDGGTTWNEYDVLGGVAVNDNADNPDVVNINITADAAGQSNVLLRWRWGGGISHYYWAVDDIMLMPSPQHEVSLISSGWGSISFAGAGHAPYTMVPDEQAQDFYMYGTISNQGANTETVTFQSEVWDGGTSVFNGNGQYGPHTMTPSLDTTDSVAAWNSGSTMTTYTIVNKFDYADIAIDNDMANNSDTFELEVTDCVYGRDLDTYSGSGLWNGDGNPYVIGPVYRMETSQTINVIQCALTGSTDPGAFIYGQIYEIDPATGDFVLVYDGSGSAGEFEVGSYHVSDQGTGLVTVNIPVTGGFTMNAGSEYIVGVGHYGGADNIVIMNGGITAPEQTVFLLDGTDQTWYYTTSTPVIRALFCGSDGVGVDEESASVELGQNVPNPFNGTTQINYSLNENSDVVFEITDVTGKLVKRIDRGMQSSGEHNIVLNAADFSKGIYYYTIKAGDFQTTKRMVVTQ